MPLVLDIAYGDMSRAYRSLYMAISNGISWGLVYDPVFFLYPSWFYSGMFLFFISVTLFAVMNVITAVFIEAAMTSTEHHRELMVQSKRNSEESYVNHIKSIFHDIGPTSVAFEILRLARIKLRLQWASTRMNIR